MKLDLKNGDMKLTINSFGAYVETFSKDRQSVFFPKILTKINDDLKARGGMHPCLPNFGADDLTGLPMHGFGRDERWEVLTSSKDGADLRLEGKGPYEKVFFFISYRLKENKLITNLTVYNRSKGPINLGPGFHPYFYCKDLDIKIEDFPIDKEKISDTLFFEGDEVRFNCNGRNFLIKGKNIGSFAIWTDFYGDYVCVEPTYKGPVFNGDGKDIYKLDKNEEFSQEFLIEIL